MIGQPNIDYYLFHYHCLYFRNINDTWSKIFLNYVSDDNISTVFAKNII